MSETVNPIAPGYHSISCFLVVPDGNKAIEFYTAVFGAELVTRNDLPDGQPAHAELRIGDSTFQLGVPMPDHGVRPPEAEWVHSSVIHYCPDVDAVAKLAREHGAREVGDPETFVNGERFSRVMDPFGHRWIVMTRVENVSREEADRRVNEWMAQQS